MFLLRDIGVSGPPHLASPWCHASCLNLVGSGQVIFAVKSYMGYGSVIESILQSNNETTDKHDYMGDDPLLLQKSNKV